MAPSSSLVQDAWFSSKKSRVQIPPALRMQIKFLCLNIWHGKLMDQVVDFIKKEEPDIMALQEVRAEDAFPDFSYTHFAPEFYHHIDGGRFLTGNAVFSKYPITSSSYSHYFEPLGEGYEDRPQMYPVLPRNLQHVQLDVGGKLLNVFNTHGVWGQDGKDTERRLAVSEKIMAATR